MKSIKTIRKLRKKYKKYNLSAPENFWKASDEELQRIYNGAGPDWMPAWARWFISLFLWLFAPAFLIHDYRFEYSDKTEEGFSMANTEMLGNMEIINDNVFPAKYWIFNRIHKFWHAKAWIAYQACKVGGWSAWID